MGPHGANVPFVSRKDTTKSKKKGCENIECARRNSEQNPLVQTSWGPLFDHFPCFNNFVKIGHNVDVLVPSPIRADLA